MAKLLRDFLARNYIIPLSLTNWFGTGHDGDAVISSDTNLPSTLDGDMVVKNYNSLTINDGYTLTVQNRCKGLCVFVRGDCVINGSLSMSKRGANFNPVDVHDAGLILAFYKAGQSFLYSMGCNLYGCGDAAINAFRKQTVSGPGIILRIDKVGGIPGGPGLNPQGGLAYKTGGGGAGGNYGSGSAASGGSSTCFGGGSGGGGGNDDGAEAGADYGGAGGAGKSGADCGGGAGNPGGAAGDGQSTPGEAGTGGLLILVVAGDLTIGAGGIIQSDGAKGGNNTAGSGSSGGGSGGGIVIVNYAGTLTNNGSIRSNGGPAGDYVTQVGQNGGAGWVSTNQINAMGVVS